MKLSILKVELKFFKHRLTTHTKTSLKILKRIGSPNHALKITKNRQKGRLKTTVWTLMGSKFQP
jgi:hypothetical protein